MSIISGIIYVDKADPDVQRPDLQRLADVQGHATRSKVTPSNFIDR